jgi:hypothetical protein
MGPTTQWRATGRPASWGSWDVEPTGNNNQAKATFKVPPSRGSQAVVRVYVDDTKVLQVQDQNSTAATFEVPDNLGPHAVRLEVCNEGGACSQSSTQDVQTYGPLVPANIHSVTPTISGRSMSWTVEVDSNGDPATLTITSDKGRVQQFSVPVGVSTFTTDVVELGYRVTETVTVTLADNGPNRGPVTATSAATTEPPPPPSIVASRGAACNDNPDLGLQPCDTGQGGGPPCTDVSCAFVHIQLGGWEVAGGSVWCTVNDAPGRPYDPNADTDSADYYGTSGGTVTVYCENGLGQQATTQFTW